MKRAYEKPRVYVETFELLEHIASCKANQDYTKVTYRDGHSCAYSDANVSLFYPGVTGCVNEYYNDVDYDSFEDYLASYTIEHSGGCYNAFIDGNFFAS